VASESLTEEVSRRLGDVHRRMEAAALRTGRNPEAIALVVVTKGHALQVVRSAYAAGVRRFGENRVEELAPKADALLDLAGVEWHLVGHLQSRKVRELPPSVAMVHSVDRPKIALRLAEFGEQRGTPLEVLLECNVSGEVTKQGWRLEDPAAWERALPEWERLSRLTGLRVLGLMTMAPQTPDAGRVRSAFRSLFELNEFVTRRLGLSWPELSMGMSDDFEIAVEEGATLLRVGRAILGERPTGGGG
jgi:PLP dependent protein